MLCSPRLWRAHVFSENISEVSENLIRRDRVCIHFVTDLFFARKTATTKCFHRQCCGTNFKNVISRCPSIVAILEKAK